MTRIMGRLAASTIAVTALIVAACGGDSRSALIPKGPPAGTPVLPDLVPEPPDVLQMLRDSDGGWSIRFTSVIVNVGAGDFALEGTRVGDDWEVEQAITYSDGGADLVPVNASMVWGGDGHVHWHVSRVASYRLEPLVDAGTEPGTEGREDSKIGFCFFDSGKALDRGPDKPRFGRKGCGGQDSKTFLMGLTPGWGDTYLFSIPGQSIDVSDIADGSYRLWAQADEQAWFREVTRDNNLTWVDFELATLADGLRTALVVAVGPRPE